MQASSLSMAASSSANPLTVIQILWKALLLPLKARILFLPLFVLAVLSSSILFFAAYSTAPLVLDLVYKLSHLFKNSLVPPSAFSNLFHDIEEDLHALARVSSVVTFLSFSASLLLAIATIYTFSAAYAGETPSPKQILLRIARRWYQTLITRLYSVQLSLSIALLSALIIGTLMLSLSDYPQVASILGISLGVSVIPLYLYLSTRWAMSIVIAVAEETWPTWGIGALSMSVVLFIGNKKRGTLLTLVVKAVETAIYGYFARAVAKTAGPPQSSGAQVAVWLAAAAASAAWGLYATAVYTVFFHECRKSQGLEEAKSARVERGCIYTSLLPAGGDGVSVTAAKIETKY